MIFEIKDLYRLPEPALPALPALPVARVYGFLQIGLTVLFLADSARWKPDIPHFLQKANQ